jgi:hypothetical protein
VRRIKRHLMGIKDHIQVILAIVAGTLAIVHIALTGSKFGIFLQIAIMLFVVKEINNYFYKTRTRSSVEEDE